MTNKDLNKVINDAQQKAWDDGTSSLWEETQYILDALYEAGYDLDTNQPHPYGGWIAVAVAADGARTTLGHYTVDQYGYDVLYLDD